MKNLFILIVILMMQSTYSQITPTKKQLKRIQQLTNPEKIIELSKGISHEKELIILLEKKEKEIVDLKNQLIKKEKDFQKTLIKIATQNTIGKKASKKIDKIQEETKPSKSFFNKINLFGVLETPNFVFDKTQSGLELSTNLKHFQFALRGYTFSNEKNVYSIGTNLIIRIKIF